MYKINKSRHMLSKRHFICTTADHINIYVYEDDPIQVPHIHFKSDNLDGGIRLDTFKYLVHGGHRKYKLNAKQLRSIVSALKFTHDISVYQFAVYTWNKYNPKTLEDALMPDYLHELDI